MVLRIVKLCCNGKMLQTLLLVNLLLVIMSLCYYVSCQHNICMKQKIHDVDDNWGENPHETGNELPKNTVDSSYNRTTKPEKASYNWLPKTSVQRVLLYNAVPKCGSQTTHAVIKQLAEPLHYTIIKGNTTYPEFYLSPFHHNRKHTREIISDFTRSNSEEFYIYKSHFHFIKVGDHTNGEQRTPFYINLVRDPVEHYVSWYYYRRNPAIFPPILSPLKWFDQKLYNNWRLRVNKTIQIQDMNFTECDDCAGFYTSSAWGKVKNMTFDECVLTGNEECIDSGYTFRMIPFFCGMDDFCLQPSRRTLNQAKRNVAIYYPLVGYLENFKQFFELAEIIWPQFFKGAVSIIKSDNGSHKNNGKWREKSDNYKPSERVKLIMKDRLKLEYEFYEWIKHRFHSMYEMYVQKKEN